MACLDGTSDEALGFSCSLSASQRNFRRSSRVFLFTILVRTELQTRLQMKLLGFLVHYPNLDRTSDETLDEAFGFSCSQSPFGQNFDKGSNKALEFSCSLFPSRCLSYEGSDETSERHFHLTLAILHTAHLNIQMKHKYFVHMNLANSNYELT